MHVCTFTADQARARLGEFGRGQQKADFICHLKYTMCCTSQAIQVSCSQSGIESRVRVHVLRTMNIQCAARRRWCRGELGRGQQKADDSEYTCPRVESTHRVSSILPGHGRKGCACTKMRRAYTVKVYGSANSVYTSLLLLQRLGRPMGITRHNQSNTRL